MGIAAVDGAPDDLGISLFKFGKVVLKTVKFSRADKSEVEGIEKKEYIFPQEVFERKVFHDIAVDNGFGFKLRRWGPHILDGS